MILLTSTPEYDYYAVPVPVKINHVWIDEGENEGESAYNLMTDYAIHLMIDKKASPVILGVIGSGEQISEEVAQQILDDGSYRPPLIAKNHYRTKILRALNEKGILLENPIEKPKFDYSFPPDGPSDSMLASAEEDYEQRFNNWQSYESRLVKAIILKVKK